MLKVILLDAEGTFLRFKPTLGKIYANLWKEYGIKIEEEYTAQRMRQTFKRVFKSALGNSKLNGEICKRAWKEVFWEVFYEYKKFPFFEEIFEKAYSFFASPECVEVVSDFWSFSEEAKSLGFKLGVISNWDGRLYSILEGHNLLNKFDAIFLGCEVGYLKPHKEIFNQALKFFQIAPKEAFMIGDTWEDDIEPAIELGMYYFWVKDKFPTVKELLKIAKI